MLDPILQKIKQRISQESITFSEAATSIGVTQQSLLRHLVGEYVRSDSLAKYRIWLEGGKSEKVAQESDVQFKISLPELSDYGPPVIFNGQLESNTLHRVVDLFCGCGGMSLGFDRLRNGNVFKTVLAIDIEEPMIRVFNDNHAQRGGELQIGRKSDMSDFLSESEIQAYYLDHLCRSGNDDSLRSALEDVGGYGLH